MKNFTNLILGLHSAVNNEEKTEFIVNCLNAARNEDKLWIIYLLSGGRIKKSISSEILRKCALETTNLPEWLFDECLKFTGDLPETISLIAPEPVKASNYTLSYWIQYIDIIRSLLPAEQIEKVLLAWKVLSTKDLYIFNKLASDSLKPAVNERVLINAIAVHAGLTKSFTAKKITGKWHPDEVTFDELFHSEDMLTDIAAPYYFFPASPFTGNQHVQNNPEKWIAEWKWDGIRAQVIKRERELFIWTKDEELVTNKFPEFETLKSMLPDGTVLDGELVCMKNNKLMSFHSVNLRMGRKSCSPKTLKESPAAFIVYDILEWKRTDIRNLPLIERAGILKSIKKLILISETLLLSQILPFNNIQDLQMLRKRAREAGAVGILLKRADSVYSNPRPDDWLSWKAEPFVINAILSYVNFGQGNDEMIFTFGVWSGRELVPVAKVVPVLPEKEFIKVYEFIKENTIERFGPVRTVKPELVFEIAFEGIARSSRHKSGVVLRNPWMGRWLKEKDPGKAPKIDVLMALLKDE